MVTERRGRGGRVMVRDHNRTKYRKNRVEKLVQQVGDVGRVAFGLAIDSF